jgi:hypothetical protein
MTDIGCPLWHGKNRCQELSNSCSCVVLCKVKYGFGYSHIKLGHRKSIDMGEWDHGHGSEAND